MTHHRRPTAATGPDGTTRRTRTSIVTDHDRGIHGYHHQKDEHLKRLRRIEGQIRGLQRMVDEDVYCIDILTQVSAVHEGPPVLRAPAPGGAPAALRRRRGGQGRRGDRREGRGGHEGDRPPAAHLRRPHLTWASGTASRRPTPATGPPRPSPRCSLCRGTVVRPRCVTLDVEHLVDTVRTEPLLDRGRRRDHQLTAQLDLGEGHVVLIGPSRRRVTTYVTSHLPSPTS